MHEQLTILNERITDLEKRLGTSEAEIASLEAFIKAYFNEPERGRSMHRRDLQASKAAWERLFGKAGIVKRAAKDQLQARSRVGM